MGTSLELRVDAADERQAATAETAVLQEIDRLTAIFSVWSATSEFSRWQKSSTTVRPVSAELFEVLELAEHWRVQSGGAFNPGAALLGQLWKQAATSNREPALDSLREACARIQGASWQLQPSTHGALRTGEHPLTLDGIAKGWIVEHAGSKAVKDSHVTGLTLNVGGDLRTWGEQVEMVQLVSPNDDSETGEPMAVVPLRNAALATSGGYRRGTVTSKGHRSHILDPRTGRPAEGILSASVIGPHSATVDALATTFCVLTPDESLRLAAKSGVECLLITADGHEVRTPGWPGGPTRLAPRPPAAVAVATTTGSDALWPADHELRVDFELAGSGERYRRPYVAVWVEDKDGFPVRSLLLWLLQSQKGQRWLPDLRSWYHADELRRVVDPTDLVATVSAATRGPGKYHVLWDGTDDQKKPVKTGTYTVFIEAVREHGSHQLLRKEFVVGGQAIKAELKGNEEIKSASIEYHPRPIKP